MLMRIIREFKRLKIVLKFRKNESISLKFGVRLNEKTTLESNIRVNKKSSIINTHLGMGTYVDSNCNLSNSYIGRFCSIASHTKIIRGMHPTKKFVSTHPAFYSLAKQAGFTFVKENIFDEFKYVDEVNEYSVLIGNDVWIGHGAIILEGITIGDGAIVAAGSIVTKDVGAYSIVGGIPAREIRKRHTQKEIDFLLNFKWWNKDFDWITNNAHFFNDIEKFMSIFAK